MSSRILIVDDETNVRLNYRITLETEGYEVVEAAHLCVGAAGTHRASVCPRDP